MLSDFGSNLYVYKNDKTNLNNMSPNKVLSLFSRVDFSDSATSVKFSRLFPTAVKGWLQECRVFDGWRYLIYEAIT